MILTNGKNSSDRELDKVILNRTMYGLDCIDIATIGILFINYDNTNSRELFYDYINDFNEMTGYKMDFFIPGFDYVEEPRTEKFALKKWRDYYHIRSRNFENNIIEMGNYAFSKEAYYCALKSISELTNKDLNKYPGNKLVMIDVEADHINERVKYGDSVMIALNNDKDYKTLWDTIKYIAQKVGEGNKAKEIEKKEKYRFIKGENVHDIYDSVLEYIKNHKVEVLLSVIF